MCWNPIFKETYAKWSAVNRGKDVALDNRVPPWNQFEIWRLMQPVEHEVFIR